MKLLLFTTCLYCIFANTPIRPLQANEIPEKLLNVNVYDYIDALKEKSPFYNEIFPDTGRQLSVKIQTLKSEEKPFCDYYWKYEILPKLYKEYICYDFNKKKSVMILTFNKTDSDDYLIDVILTQFDEFISEYLFEHLIYFPKMPVDSKIGEKCQKQYDLLHASMMKRDFEEYSRMVEEDFNAAGFSDSEQGLQAIKGIKTAFDAFNGMTEKFELTAEKQYLGCYQVGRNLYSTSLLIHTKKYGYGVITMIMEQQGELAYSKKLFLLFNQDNIFINIPGILTQNRH